MQSSLSLSRLIRQTDFQSSVNSCAVDSSTKFKLYFQNRIEYWIVHVYGVFCGLDLVLLVLWDEQNRV